VRWQNGVQSCAATCAGSLTFGDCKFCPTDVTGFDFGVQNESDRCHFCPEQDVKYPDREVPLFGDGTKCWQMQKFFEAVEVHKDSQNCRLAQMMNYVCGCAGPGYGGASTEAKKNVLVWLPRTMAVLSFLGSLFILIDATKTQKNRKKLFHQLMAALSTFDIFGSIAYAFTSLPMPADDYIVGSKGNTATCIAQGFFIQIGTISCYINVSLSVYYLLVIKMGKREQQMKKYRMWLFVCPITVGLAFAFAGIPFYDNMILWCNNAASWWPEIPVALAILIATVIMTIVCCDVYQKEKASARWRSGHSQRRAENRISKKVFWQSFWYLIAFYFTWPAYLALQYSWASGKAFSRYGLIVFAGTTVPLQGFFNFIVYIRPRYMNTDNVTSRMSTIISRRFISDEALSTTLRATIKSWMGNRRRTTTEMSASVVKPVSDNAGPDPAPAVRRRSSILAQEKEPNTDSM